MKTGAAVIRLTGAYRLALAAIALLVLTMPLALIAFTLGATGLISGAWFVFVLVLTLGEVLVAWVGVAGMMLRASRVKINMTDPFYIKDMTDPFYIKEMMGYVSRDLRSVLRSARLAESGDENGAESP